MGVYPSNLSIGHRSIQGCASTTLHLIGYDRLRVRRREPAQLAPELYFKSGKPGRGLQSDMRGRAVSSEHSGRRTQPEFTAGTAGRNQRIHASGRAVSCTGAAKRTAGPFQQPPPLPTEKTNQNPGELSFRDESL